MADDKETRLEVRDYVLKAKFLLGLVGGSTDLETQHQLQRQAFMYLQLAHGGIDGYQ